MIKQVYPGKCGYSKNRDKAKKRSALLPLNTQACRRGFSFHFDNRNGHMELSGASKNN